MMRARSSMLTGLATLAILGGGLALTDTPALAGTGYGFSFSFENAPNGFEQPIGLAVDDSGGPNSGDVYVTDQLNGTLDKFTPAGSLLASVKLPTLFPADVAVDNY